MLFQQRYAEGDVEPKKFEDQLRELFRQYQMFV
jgi:hypothetical protein